MSVEMEPRDTGAVVVLPGHERVRIRPLGFCEDGPIRSLDRRLSTRTRYLRFFSPMPALSDSLVEMLACVDGRRRLALVAERERDGAVEVVGLANFGAIDDETAEFGIVVQDDWQRRGLGTALLDWLLRAAADRGFERFVAHVLTENWVIRKLLKRFGRITHGSVSYGVAELAFVPTGAHDRSCERID